MAYDTEGQDAPRVLAFVVGAAASGSTTLSGGGPG